MCRRAFENGKIVWANAKVCEGLVGRNVPLHTAIAFPMCTLGDDVCIVVLFSVGIVQMTPRAIQYLCATKAALPYYDKLVNFPGLNSLTLQEYQPNDKTTLQNPSPYPTSTPTQIPSSTNLDSIPSVPSWINLAFQDMDELVTCSDGSVNGLHSSWSYLRLSNLWNPTNENGTTIVDGKHSYTELKERFHELMIGLLHLTNFEITELWLVEDSQEDDHMNPSTNHSSNSTPNHNNIHNTKDSNPNAGKLSVVAAFHTDTALQPWAAFTRLITLTVGLDFPGQVVQSGRPITDNNYGQHHIYDPLYPRALHSKELGLKCAFGVPLPRASDVCGTLVFYSRHDIKINPKLITMITAAAYLLAGSWQVINQLSTSDSIESIQHIPSSDYVDILQRSDSFTNGNGNGGHGGININDTNNNNLINNYDPNNINNINNINSDFEVDASRNYEIESKTLIDFAFSNALEFFSDNLDSWNDQNLLNSLNEHFDNSTLSDPLSTFPDAGRKRSRTTRSPRSSFGQLSDVFEDERCRRCYRQKDKFGQYCQTCEQFLSMQSNNVPPPISNMSTQLIHQPLPTSIDQKIQSSNISIPRSASSLFGIPPSASAFMPQYCMPTNIYNEYQQQQLHYHHQQQQQFQQQQQQHQFQQQQQQYNFLYQHSPNMGQFYQPHRRPSAEIALAMMSNEGFYMGETNINSVPYMKLYPDHISDLNMLDSNIDSFHQNIRSLPLEGTSQHNNPNTNNSTINNINNNNNNSINNNNNHNNHHHQNHIPNNINNGISNLNINPTVKICKYRGYKNTTVQRSPYCASHAGSRKCQQEGCTKCAQGSTKLCIAHGGGRRCTYPGCTKGARDKFFCAGHGGGKRCEVDGCSKSAVGSSKFCTNHGGGKRCKEPGCQKSAQSSTPYCVRHGGGRKCCIPGCTKVIQIYFLFIYLFIN